MLNFSTLTIHTWAPKLVSTGSESGLEPSLHGSKTKSLHAASSALLPAFFNLVSSTNALPTSAEPIMNNTILVYYKGYSNHIVVYCLILAFLLESD